MESIEQIISFLVLYFQSRNIHQFGFVGYKIYKNLITYITGLRDVSNLRTIFEKMVKIGWFTKRRTGSKTDYQFVFDNKPQSKIYEV